MKLQNAIENCRTIHSYKNESIETHVIEKALSNALLAPNHKFTFPWKFYWIKGALKEKIAKLNVEIKKQKLGSMSEESEQKALQKLLNPEIIVFSQIKNEDSFVEKEDYATMSCSVQLFGLTLTSFGYGYKWSTGKVTRDLKTYELLGIDSSKEEIIGFLLAGVKEKEASSRRRPDLKDVLVRCE